MSFGWSDFARRYFRSLGWFPFLQVLRCFSSPRSLCIPMYSECNNHCWLGSPIRTSADQCLFTAPHGFSQCITSFFASDCQGIHQMPLPIAWFLQYKHFAFTICSYHLNKKSFLPVILSNFGVYFYTFLPRFFDNTIFSYHTIQLFPYSQCFIASLWNLFGGGKENRTPDPLLAKQMLSQLSYTPNCWWVWEDLNFRPHAYQACALTTWATNPFFLGFATPRLH